MKGSKVEVKWGEDWWQATIKKVREGSGGRGGGRMDAKPKAKLRSVCLAQSPGLHLPTRSLAGPVDLLKHCPNSPQKAAVPPSARAGVFRNHFNIRVNYYLNDS